MNKTLGILALLAAPALGVAQEGARPVSLQEAIDLATRNAPGMVSARGQLRTSAMALRQAKWAFSPFENMAFSYGSSTGGGSTIIDGIVIPRPNSDWSYSQGFGGASVDLWDGGAKLSTLRQRRAQVQAAEVNEVTQTFNITQQVKTQYYQVLRANEQLVTAQIQLQNAELQMRMAQARLSAGAGLAADTLQSFIQVLTAQNSILNARNSIANANAQLTRLAGSPFAITAIVSDTADPAPLRISDEELFALAAQGPSVRSSEASLNVSRASEKASQAILWPTITASGSFSRRNSDTDYDFGAGPMAYSWSFGLNARWTLWNNFGREASLLNARVNRDNAEANFRNAQLVARQEMTSLLGTLRTNEAQIALNRAQVLAAEENLRVVQQRYDLGVGLLIDLQNAQQQLTSARASLTNSRFDIRNTRAQIEALIGRDLPQQ